MSSRSLRAAALLSLTLSVAAAYSQTVAPSSLRPEINLHGLVQDPLGASVAGASVELLDARGQVVASATGGSDGAYALAVPASGQYRLRIAAPTFRLTTTAPVYLSASGNEARNLTLETPTYSEQVTVTASGTPTPLAQSGAPVTVLTQADYPHSPELQQPLRLVPGVQVTQTGQTGGATSLFLRGADSDATKILLDGTPLNDIGGAVNFANLATVGISRIEVLRQPNSALYGSDALAGVVNFTTTRGTSPLPLLSYAVDGGNYGLFRQEADLSGAHGRFDFYNGIARLGTSNSIANNAFHNATFAGNYGYTPDSKTDLRLTVRHLAVNGGEPNAIALYGIPDNTNQTEHDLYLNAALNHQTSERWHNELQYGHERLRGQANDFTPTGIPDPTDGIYLGAPVTLTGANGYTVSGQAVFQYVGTYPTASNTSTNRDFVYAQSDYKFGPHLTGLAAFRYEDERGYSLYNGGSYTSLSDVDHGNYSYTLQLAGDLRSRFFYTLGSGIEDNAVYGKALTPRVSLAYYLVRPASQSFLSGTKLHASFGKGIKGPNIGQETSSLYDLLQLNAPALIPQDHIRPIGAEYSRTYDVGVEQQFGNGRARLNLTFFHNEFTGGFQDVSTDALVALGVPQDAATATLYGAYVNSQAFRALGAETELELRLASHLFVRAGYTYLDAVVQHSFSSDALSPSFNTSFSFPNTPIGVYAPLDGARPFRRAPHTGYFALQYNRNRLETQLSGTLVGRRDDSTFLTDSSFGNSLLLPNRNLDGAYQRLELTSTYRINAHLSTYANLQNLLNEHYFEAFGYPALPFNLRGGIKLSLGGESWKLR
jgi:iron complex outermembrane receptor protein/vitamin B12 transporter